MSLSRRVQYWRLDCIAAIITALRTRTINYCALANELEKMKGCTPRTKFILKFLLEVTC